MNDWSLESTGISAGISGSSTIFDPDKTTLEWDHFLPLHYQKTTDLVVQRYAELAIELEIFLKDNVNNCADFLQAVEKLKPPQKKLQQFRLKDSTLSIAKEGEKETKEQESEEAKDPPRSVFEYENPFLTTVLPNTEKQSSKVKRDSHRYPLPLENGVLAHYYDNFLTAKVSECVLIINNLEKVGSLRAAETQYRSRFGFLNTSHVNFKKFENLSKKEEKGLDKRNSENFEYSQKYSKFWESLWKTKNLIQEFEENRKKKGIRRASTSDIDILKDLHNSTRIKAKIAQFESPPTSKPKARKKVKLYF